MNKIEIPKPNGKEKPRLSAISVHYLVMISSSLIKKIVLQYDYYTIDDTFQKLGESEFVGEELRAVFRKVLWSYGC